MGFTQIIEYTDVEVTLPPPVKKQIWDGEKFVPMTLYKIKGLPAIAAQKWFLETFGPKKYTKPEDIGSTVELVTLL
jgi:hypothetical protein